MATAVDKRDLEQAEQHAAEAKRLLAGRLGLISNYVKAQVHATLAVYYLQKHELPTSRD
jgi:hypothetical protein